MGALTIKSYTFETRIWELTSVIFPNLLTSFPYYLSIYLKNARVVRILPYNRNDFISNTTRFSYTFFNKLMRQPSLEKTNNISTQCLLAYSFFFINFVFNITFNGLLKDPMCLLNQKFYTLTRTNFFLSPCLYSVDSLEDDFNFIVFSNEVKTNLPDFFYFLLKDQFVFTEIENYDEDAIIEKGDRFCSYFKCNNLSFLWYIYTLNTDLLVYLVDLPVSFSPYNFYSFSQNFCYLTSLLIQNEFYYFNSFGLPIK